MIGVRLPALKWSHGSGEGVLGDHLSHLLEVPVAVEQKQALATQETVRVASDGYVWCIDTLRETVPKLRETFPNEIRTSASDGR